MRVLAESLQRVTTGVNSGVIVSDARRAEDYLGQTYFTWNVPSARRARSMTARQRAGKRATSVVAAHRFSNTKRACSPRRTTCCQPSTVGSARVGSPVKFRCT